MKKFKFRLQPLLRVREHLEKERQKELAVVLHQIRGQQNALTELSRSRTATMSSQRNDSIGFLSATHLLVYSRYLLRLKGKELADSEILKELEIKADGCRERLTEASKQKQIFEKLKEKQFDNHRLENEKAENAELDEIAIMSFARRGREEARS